MFSIFRRREAFDDRKKHVFVDNISGMLRVQLEEPTHPQGKAPEELRRDCAHYMQALERPVLEYSDF